MPSVEAGSFRPLQRLLHWSMAVLIVGMLLIGFGMVSTVSPLYPALLATHRTVGMVVLALALVRLVVRLRLGAPPLPVSLPRAQRAGAAASHVALYGLMIGMPLLGWATVSAGGYPMILLGGWRVPPILPPDEATYALLREAHVWLSLLLLAVLLLHVGAALNHAWVRRDGVFESMAGRWLSRVPRAGRIGSAVARDGADLP